MKITIALAAAFAALAMPLAAHAASKHRHPHHAGYGTYARSGGQIACTQYGCIPVPRGCYARGGRTYSGMPSGFDVVVCGRSSLYGNY